MNVVAVVASAAPVLLLVCDGMPLLVAHRLLRDLLDEGWAPASPPQRERWPVGVGVLPTVTEICRTSLLTGQRLVGGQAEEREGFSGHRSLRAVSTMSKPPVLFHKASLVTPAGVALPEEVRRAVADPQQRVVGVVVNAVDDHLAWWWSRPTMATSFACRVLINSRAAPPAESGGAPPRPRPATPKWP